MGRGLFEPWHIILLVAVVAVLFGWKKLPDISRSVGRSMRIFKSEVSEMKNDGKDSKPSPAAADTVRGDVVTPPQQPTVPPQPQAAPQPSPQPQPAQPVPGPQPAVQPAQDRQNGAREPQHYDNPAL